MQQSLSIAHLVECIYDSEGIESHYGDVDDGEERRQATRAGEEINEDR